jgi:hypothetical protein
MFRPKADFIQPFFSKHRAWIVSIFGIATFGKLRWDILLTFQAAIVNEHLTH